MNAEVLQHRKPKDLKALADGALKLSGGTMDCGLNAYSPEEEATLKQLLKGRHGAKCVTVRLVDPSEAMTLTERIDAGLSGPRGVPAVTPKEENYGY